MSITTPNKNTISFEIPINNSNNNNNNTAQSIILIRPIIDPYQQRQEEIDKMKNERKFLFKRKMKLLCISSVILFGLTLVLWFYVSIDNIIDDPFEETSHGSIQSKIPLKNSFDDKPKTISSSNPHNSHSNLNPQSEVNSQYSDSESTKEIKPLVMSKHPKESQSVTTHPIIIKTYKTFNLTLRNETKMPDGFSRYVYTINNQFPGPEIIVNEGDTIRINITNYIGHPTTIHVHGMIHNEMVYMDGVPYVTQCPIQNGSSFTYEFEATHPGTYWYYSHYETQRADGLYGALIVKDPKESKFYNYDNEKIILLSDWYHNESSILLKNYQYSNASIFNFFEPIPDSGLINGKGIFDCVKYEDDPKKKEKCNSKSLKVEEFHFEPHKKNRLRIINTSAMTSFYLSIDGHTLQVIEVDGTPTILSSRFHRLKIHVGQRYSIIPIRHTQHKKTSNFYLRAEIIKKSFRSTTPHYMLNSLPTELKAIIRYDNKDTSLPSTSSWTLQQLSSKFPLIDLNPLDLKPYVQEALPKNMTFYQFDLIIDKYNKHNNSLKFSHKGFIGNDNLEYFYGYINSVHRGPSIYNPNKNTNTLRSLLEGIIKSFPYYRNVYVFKGRWTINVLLNNDDDFDQVFYLHGHKFWILGQGTILTPEYSDLNHIDPIKRDTVVVPALGWTLIKFNIDNPGIWAFSNPIVWHQNIGMLGQIIELPKDIRKLSRAPPIEWCKLCNDKSNLEVCQKKSGLMNEIKNIWNRI